MYGGGGGGGEGTGGPMRCLSYCSINPGFSPSPAVTALTTSFVVFSLKGLGLEKDKGVCVCVGGGGGGRGGLKRESETNQYTERQTSTVCEKERKKER